MGQADGELGPHLVREIVNLELNSPGELNTRAPLATTETPLANVFRVYYMSADPSGSSPGGWEFRLKATEIDVVDDQGVVQETLSLGLTASNLSEVEIHGDMAIVAAVDSSGDPLDTFIVTHDKSQTRFAGPQHESGYGTINEDSYSGGWEIKGMSRPTPTLIDHSFEDLTQYRSGADPAEDTNEVSNLIAAVSGALEAPEIDSDTILLLWTIDHENPDSGALNEPAEHEFRIQFEYADGSTSSLSNPVYTAIPASVRDGNMVAFTVCARHDLDPSVKSINIYRRIDEAGEYDLLSTAHIYSEELEDETVEVGTTVSWRERDLASEADMSSGGWDSYAERVETSSPFSDGSVLVRGYNGSLGSGVNTFATSGWRRYSDTCIYFPRHYTFNGQMRVRMEEGSGDGFGEWLFSASGLAPASINGSPTARIMGGCLCPIPRLYMSGGDVYIANGGSYEPELPHWWVRGLISVDSLDDQSAYNGSTATIDSVGTFTAQSCANNIRPLVFMIDRGQPGILTYKDVEGVTDEERVEVKPRHIAVVNGRLLCLNTVWDDEDYRSRLAWSEYGKFRSFSNTSYNEYGYSDDGRGVGIAKHGSKILILNTSCIHGLDVSGGSDMAWREITADYNIGCLSLKHYIETPFGVVFCDKRKAYIWNGQLKCITEDMRRNITRTYSSFISGGVTGMGYLPSMQQVWIMSGQEALVYDITREAWHRHDFTEMSSGDDLMGIIVRDNLEYAEISSSGDATKSLVDHQDTTAPPFGFKINTGPITMGVPEIVKKLKRVYIETNVEAGDGTFSVTCNGDTPLEKNNPGSGVTRVSKSIRDYSIEVEIDVPEDDAWRGAIREIGISYKPKRLK